jgi:hypothetical protein
LGKEASVNCPYHLLPASSWWDRGVGGRRGAEIFPFISTTLRIDRQTRVASAGSCFAQNISKALVNNGFNYFVTENAPNYLSTEQAVLYNYGVFSARYGNIYTTLQLLQLVQRAFGLFKPCDQFWQAGDGRCFDLLRPRITPNGFASQAEAEADLRQHLAAVRLMFETADVFVFTLGLTEGWVSTADGVAYPTCPGCGNAGNYVPDRYAFRNLTVAETSSYLSEAITLIQRANPAINIILTVSPVPLIATMEQRHVLQATTYSKSVLRVAAEQIVDQHTDVYYFASYEIINATHNTHVYFAEDGRSVSDKGVADAMALFFKHFCGDDVPGVSIATVDDAPSANRPEEPPPGPTSLICDEEEFYRAIARNRAP